MKRFRNYNLAIVAFIIFLTLVKFLINPGREGNDFTTATTSGREYSVPLNDSMPHYQYRRVEDSLNRANYPPKEEDHTKGSGSTFFGTIGFYEVVSGDQFAKEYYLGLGSYEADPDVKFFRQDRNNYITKHIWDKVQTDSNGDKHAYGHDSTYLTTAKFIEENTNTGEGMVFLPIFKRNYLIGNTMMIALSTVLGLAALFIPFICFVRFLFAIARGDAFSASNVRRLNTIAYIFIFVGLMPALLKIVLYFMFKTRLPHELNFAWYDSLTSGLHMVVLGLIFLLFANAFRQGAELEKDRDLTI